MNFSKNMKSGYLKIAFSMLIVLFAASSSMAQDGDLASKTPEERAELLTEKQKEKLDFKEGQEEKMYALNLKYAEKMEELKGEGRSISTLKKMQSLSKDKDKEVKEILDDDQYKTYKEIKDEMRGNMKSQMRARRGSGGSW